MQAFSIQLPHSRSKYNQFLHFNNLLESTRALVFHCILIYRINGISLPPKSKFEESSILLVLKRETRCDVDTCSNYRSNYHSTNILPCVEKIYCHAVYCNMTSVNYLYLQHKCLDFAMNCTFKHAIYYNMTPFNYQLAVIF